MRPAVLLLVLLCGLIGLTSATTTCFCDCCLSSYSDHPCPENGTSFEVSTCTTCSLLECLRFPSCVQKIENNDVVPRCVDPRPMTTLFFWWVFCAGLGLLLIASVLRFYVPKVDQCVRFGEDPASNTRRREASKLKKARLQRVLEQGSQYNQKGVV